MNEKNITRTAAIIFSEESSAIKSTTVQRKIIESIFVENENKELTIDEIIDNLNASFEMNFDFDEVKKIVNDDKHSHFEVRYDNKIGDNYFKLLSSRVLTLKTREEQFSIFPHIENFKNQIYSGNVSVDRLDEVLHKYFYELLNKNIQSFRKISKPVIKSSDIFLDPNIFDVEEREAINAFLEWDNVNKNKSIFALISYSLEYAVITNHYESSSIFLNSIKNKVFYLDNNVLYRAIGLNGDSRKKRIREFLRKCKSAGQTFKVSKFTEKEFKETIRHHIRSLQKVPFRKINYNLFSKYSLDPSIYEYYHKWKASRTTYSFDLFITHLYSELDSFLKDFKIELVYSIPFEESGKEEQKIIEKYKDEISSAKGYGNEQSHYFDAVNTFLIEKLRNGNQNSITDTKYFFVSTDQKLRAWDFSRNDYQPVALIPSQWMAILLKYFSRTDNDYASFISFLKLKTNQPIVNEDCLQTILAGISELTEDFEKQSSILEKMVEIKFEGILNGSNKAQDVYKKTVNYVTKEFESEIQNLNKSKENSEINLSKQNIDFKSKLLSEKEESFKELSKQKIPIENQAELNLDLFKLKFVLAIISYFIILAIIKYQIKWEGIDTLLFFLGPIGIISSYLYPAIYGKDLNPLVYFEKKREEFKLKTFKNFNFNLERYIGMKNEIEELKTNIEELKMAHNSTYP
jgi:hypothetical protein